LAASAASKTTISGKRNPFSSTRRITPKAERRSANGSLEPVGFSSMLQKPANVSIFSANATATETGSAGHASPGPSGW